MAVIDIRGTHGSGKSWLAHKLIQRYKGVAVKEKDKIVGYHLPKIDGFVLGKYETECGGCDGIKTPQLVVDYVKHYGTKHRVLVLEGILVSHTFKRYSELATYMEDRGCPYTFCFLNTPLRNCIGRVRARRIRKGQTKPFNPTHLKNDWHQIWERTRSKCIAADHAVEILDWKNPLPRVLELVEGCNA